MRPGRARDRPRSGERLRVAEVRPEVPRAVGQLVVEVLGERHRDVGEVVDVGEAPGLGAVGEVPVGQHDDRRAVLEREAHAFERGVEAVARRLRGDDRQRRLTVAAVHREHEVGLLGLRRQSGRRAAALHVDEHERQLHADRESERLGLEVHPGTARRGHAELTGERATDGDADRGDLVLGLHRAHTEVLVLRQLVEDVGRRGDRVRRVEDRAASPSGPRR